MVRWIVRSLVGLSCLGMAACNGNTPGGTGKSGPGPEAKLTAAELGPVLYKADPAEKIPPFSGIEEQITVPNAVVRLDKKQTVPAQVDAYLEVIGTQLPAGTPYNPADKDIIMYQADLGRPTEKVPFRRIREGDKVTAGQVVAMFNVLEVAVQIESSQKIIGACTEAIKVSKEGAGYIREQLKQMDTVKNSGAVSKAEILNLQATLARYEENVINSEKEKVKSEGDEKKGWAMFAKHQARSMVNGIVTKVMRSPGEFLKAGEPVMEILATDEQMVEGNLDVKDAWAVTPGMKVTVEPANPIGPDPKYGSIDHRLEVTGVAVTAHPGRPLIVSASLDGTAAVWDLFPPDGKPRNQLRLQHPAGVRSVAATGAKAGNNQRIATGGDDGKVRVWDAPAFDKIAADKPSREGDDAHGSAVVKLAFSPDGRFIASAAGRDVWVWDAGTGKKLYALPAEHKDAVTDVQFTPQATLVTAARDRAPARSCRARAVSASRRTTSASSAGTFSSRASRYPSRSSASARSRSPARSRIFPSMMRVWTRPNRSPVRVRISRACALAAIASSILPRSWERSAMLNSDQPRRRRSWAFSARLLASWRATSPSSTRSCWLRTMPR